MGGRHTHPLSTHARDGHGASKQAAAFSRYRQHVRKTDDELDRDSAPNHVGGVRVVEQICGGEGRRWVGPF